MQMLAMHLVDCHVAYKVKPKIENSLGVSSTSALRTNIKQEENEKWGEMDPDQRPAPTYGGFVDLTEDV